MLGVERTDASELGQHIVCYLRRLDVARTAVHDAMSNGVHRLPALPHPFHDPVHACGVIGRPTGEPDALDLSGQRASRQIARREEGELETRGAGIHAEDGGHRRAWYSANRDLAGLSGWEKVTRRSGQPLPGPGFCVP